MHLPAWAFVFERRPLLVCLSLGKYANKQLFRFLKADRIIQTYGLSLMAPHLTKIFSAVANGLIGDLCKL